jgi:hypothetical protein
MREMSVSCVIVGVDFGWLWRNFGANGDNSKLLQSLLLLSAQQVPCSSSTNKNAVNSLGLVLWNPCISG